MKIRQLIDLIIPRFITEDVALHDNGQGYEIVCCMDDVQPGERFDGVATMRCFNLFGSGIWPKQVGEVRPWPGR